VGQLNKMAEKALVCKTNEDTGVGAAIAAGSQAENGI
jgi:hypothetical protein